MAGIPLGPPPVTPIANAVMLAPELPANRPQTHATPEISSTAPYPGGPPLLLGEYVPAAPRHTITPADVESRAERVHDMTWHDRTADPIGGARLDPHNPEVPFGATVIDLEGQPITSETGPEVDPYCLTSPSAAVLAAAGAVAKTGGGDADELLGDGSLEDAVEAVEAVRRSSGGGRDRLDE
ncbi:hypothetical protein GPECTOR_14g251 [Gonium pectorale]|uniref:Uncharacterized protein n=1 Tax=Gonium pectorale TaxID=33097 RepID=A0A150GNW1_GONPE|nr:hypothetical protein GPECTOR_14g251 [Gonium pectorale]|eukprot:KXZ51010.1 hypothetical protein GPECTOR_14g251 [Gonium pectorale]